MGTRALPLVGGRDDRIVPILDHALHLTCCEGLYGRVELVDNKIAAPPTHESDCVGDESFQDKFHETSLSYRACTDHSWFETNL